MSCARAVAIPYSLGASYVCICPLRVHTIPYVYTLPLFANCCRLSKDQYGPRPTFDPYMATLRGIVNNELPSYRLKILYPTAYQTHHFGTRSNTYGNRSTSALDAPTRYTPRIMSYAPFCALVSTHESMGPALDANSTPIQALDGTN